MVRTLRCELDGERMEKKIQQWQKIAIAACEQCGRNTIPEIRPLMKLQQWCAEPDDALKLNLHPRASYSIRTLPAIPKAGVRLLIGSEGGLSPTRNCTNRGTWFCGSIIRKTCITH